MRIFPINYNIYNSSIKTFKNSQPLRGEVVEVTTTSTETNVKENNSEEPIKEKNTNTNNSIVEPKKKDKKEFFLKRLFKKINIFSRNKEKKEKYKQI